MTVEVENEVSKCEYLENVTYLLLKNSNIVFYKDVPAYNMDICGKKIINCVKEACRSNDIILVEYGIEDNIFDIVRSNVKKKKGLLVVLYADSPLLTPFVIKECLSLFLTLNVKICRLPRGYIIDLESFNSGGAVAMPQKIGEIYTNEFIPVNNLYAYKNVQEEMSKRIIAHHIENGVIFRDGNTVQIDFDVKIGKGTVIFPNNYIYSASEIGEDCVLLPNNVVISSTIGANCTLCGAYLKNAQISKKTTIQAFERVEEESR